MLSTDKRNKSRREDAARSTHRHSRDTSRAQNKGAMRHKTTMHQKTNTQAKRSSPPHTMQHHTTQQKKILRAGKVQSDKWWVNHQLEILLAVIALLWIGLEFLT